MNKENITKEIEFGFSDDEYLPITKCLCGAKFDLWEESISIYKTNLWECPHCGARMFWKFRPQVFLVS